MRKKEIKENFHHTVMILMGLRERNTCPNCGSTEWYRRSTYQRCDEEFSDGHVISRDMDYCWSSEHCNNCEHEIDHG